MPKEKASRRHKFNHWDDDEELDAPRSSGRDDRKNKSVIHINKKDRTRTKHGHSDFGLADTNQLSWPNPDRDADGNSTDEDSGDIVFDEEISLSLAEIRELAERNAKLLETTGHLLHNGRKCGIDFGPDIDRQYVSLKKRVSEVEAKIQAQKHLYQQEADKLQQSLGKDSALVVAEMIRFETKKQSDYTLLQKQCLKLFIEIQAFHEGIEGLTWNLDQCD